MMGGVIVLLSLFGQGSWFEVCLMLVVVDCFVVKVWWEKCILGYLGLSWLIVVVDDNLDYWVLVWDILVLLGFVVLEVGSGWECFDVIVLFNLDFFLVDILMFGMIGWQLVVEFWLFGVNVLIVMLLVNIGDCVLCLDGLYYYNVVLFKLFDLC